MNPIEDNALRTIAEKVENQIPVDKEDARILLTTNHILDLGEIADHIRKRLHGPNTYYSLNINLNYTNICEVGCPLCAFYKSPGDEAAYQLSLDDIENRVSTAVANGVEEIHIVGGLHPDLKLDYFESMLARIRGVKPDLFIVGFSAVEYDYFARINHLPLETVFRRLMDAGVNALPGGGAEIFSPRVRALIAPKKISGTRWLEIMETAHRLGLQTNATLLYNHVESVDDIVDHLFRLRELQDRTQGFKTFVPLVFHEENTRIKAKRHEPTGYDDLRIYATARIVLHNIPHIKALWMYLGEKMAQVMLNFGADDIGGTYQDEKVVHAAGAKTSNYGTEPFLRKLIEDAGKVPVRTTAGYNAASGVSA